MALAIYVTQPPETHFEAQLWHCHAKNCHFGGEKDLRESRAGFKVESRHADPSARSSMCVCVSRQVHITISSLTAEPFVSMLKRPPLHTDPTLEPALALLVRSMRTALGPAEDEEFAEATQASTEAVSPQDSSVPSAGIVRIPTLVRSSRSSHGKNVTPTGTYHTVNSSCGHREDATSSDTYDVPADTDNPLLTGVLRRTRHRSASHPRVERSNPGVPLISALPPGDSLQWDELNEPVSDPEVDAFLCDPEPVPVRTRQSSLVTEAPTPFAPASYAVWSERNSRGE